MSEFVFDAHAARTCPVKVQNLLNPLVPKPSTSPDESLRDSFHGGIDFERHVLDQIVATAKDRCVDLRSLSASSYAEQEAACRAAMAEGTDLIVGGRVPPDRQGHRAGHADVWARHITEGEERPGYYPIEVKWHRVLESRKSGRQAAYQWRVSPLSEPWFNHHRLVEDTAFRISSREGDLLQMAHYWRLLESTGFAAMGQARAGIVGTDQLEGRLVVSWIDLEAKSIRTFARTALAGWRLRSPLERYDHEHGFRQRVARAALAQTGGPHDPPLLVKPIVIRECGHCLWWDICRPQLDDDDLSLRIEKAPLDVREISVLRAQGIQTIDELATVDIDRLLEVYLPEVAHRDSAESRLRLAHRRAKMMADGIELVRLTKGPIALPTFELEIDFDIETSADDRVYLWGFLVHRGEESQYVSFAEFADLDDATEAALAEKAMQWLREQVSTVESAAVYHYSSYEIVRLGQLARRFKGTHLAWATQWAPRHFVDMFSLIQQHFFAVNGLGLKTVAHQGAGFEWRDDDPGGLNSQAWFDEAVHGETPEERDAARRRVLDYNEDDVVATAELRRWIRRDHAGANPASPLS